MLDVKWGRI